MSVLYRLRRLLQQQREQEAAAAAAAAEEDEEEEVRGEGKGMAPAIVIAANRANPDTCLCGEGHKLSLSRNATGSTICFCAACS